MLFLAHMLENDFCSCYVLKNHGGTVIAFSALPVKMDLWLLFYRQLSLRTIRKDKKDVKDGLRIERSDFSL
jgi:hypothetical protein